MKCSQCNYFMDAFDKECSRCHGRGLNQPSTTTTNPSSPQFEPPAPSHNASIQPAPTTIPAPVQPVPTHPLPIQPTPFQCRCVVCGNEAVQKVSAICSAGNWASNTQGAISTNTVGGAMGLGNARGSYAVGVATTRGTVSSNTAGSTQLAQALNPPQRPHFVFKTLPIVTGCYWAIGAAALSGLIAFSGGGARWWLFLVASAMLSAFLIYMAVPAHRQHKESFNLNSETAYRRWVQAMEHWNYLFYCSRCDNLYNSQTNQAAPVHQMNYLI